MWDILFWLYIVNATLLTTHEMDSAYWKEWDLFHLPGGASGFLLIHIPLLFVLFYGVTWMLQQSYAGLVLSLILGSSGMFAFCIHMFFIGRGRAEFKTPVSICILLATLVVSTTQSVLTISMLLGRPLL